MEKVCYILGAGFSRPLGLPLMSDFLSLAKDMWLREPGKYRYFEEIFRLFDSFSKIHNFLHTDQSNIEELLSLAEMQDFLSETKNSETVQRFISDVIKSYTPEFKSTKDSAWLLYIAFAAVLQGLEEFPRYTYSVVTLNYDTVVENAVDFLRKTHVHDDNDRRIEREPKPFPLAKLHGCVTRGNIIPPTWNKYRKDEVADVWKVAFKAVSEANHIRIIGYSLPESDSYIKYLLKISILNACHLKSVDVVCLDGDGKTKDRYDKIMKFGGYRYLSLDVNTYLKRFFSKVYFIGDEKTLCVKNPFDANKYWPFSQY